LLPRAKTVGMAVYWHNRIGLAPRGVAKPDHLERTLDRLPACF
jgi:2-haloacid dehalogenase